jgi:1,4-alpha-glucan branching enzyme
MADTKRRKSRTLLTKDDLYFFNEGTHNRLYEQLGAHPRTLSGEEGYNFAVWAPNAERVSVMGDFNAWAEDANPLSMVGNSGIWDGFVPGVAKGARYKFRIVSHGGAFQADKTDPFAYYNEIAPATASITWDLDYSWNDSSWMVERGRRAALNAPISIYEVHLGSWRRTNGESMTYRDVAAPLAEHVKRLGFTHVELLPIMEHPFYGSWGYQTTGYFSPTSRHGTPQDFMHLVDYLHQNDIGVILDWVPSHFPGDAHGLYYFDGTHLFEHADPRQGFHPDWSSYIFNYGRHEVRSFLLSSALFWMDVYHADGLRVDAVASMLYLDYSRKQGEWIPNKFGGRENLEAIDFLRRMNTDIYQRHPDSQTIAEESTAWPMVSRPTYVGGLGFGMKWDMGWMHDSLEYFSRDPIHRRYHHGKLTFRGIYAYTENFVMPLSHDEVVHGKGSLINKMPGDEWRKFANLRLLYGYMYTQPGKKLMFMGGEIAQYREWNHDGELDWQLLEYPMHQGVMRWVSDLNAFYREEPAAHRCDTDPAGFQWIDADDALNSVLSYIRRDDVGGDQLVVVCNCTPLIRENYRVGVPTAGFWREVLNSDADVYGGSGVGNLGGVASDEIACHGRVHSINLTLPPLAIVVLKHQPGGRDGSGGRDIAVEANATSNATSNAAATTATENA